MEYIYFAVSESYPGMVKIGRTDRPVSQRMSELSSDDYGPSESSADSTWQAFEILQVENNSIAEPLLHRHFADLRVEDNREIFFSNDVSSMAAEGAEVAGGTKVDLLEALNGSASSVDDGAEVAEVLELVLMLGLAGVGLPIAAILYIKYKDSKAVKKALKNLKLAIENGESQWHGSSQFRADILARSAERFGAFTSVASAANKRAKVASLRYVSKVRDVITKRR